MPGHPLSGRVCIVPVKVGIGRRRWRVLVSEYQVGAGMHWLIAKRHWTRAGAEKTARILRKQNGHTH